MPNVDHKCKQNKFDNECPICKEYLFTSQLNSISLICSHTIHSECLKEYLKTNYACPICHKSLGEMSNHNAMIANAIENEPMPPELSNKIVKIICNDCLEKTETTFHFYGNKCLKCGSFNTSQI